MEISEKDIQVGTQILFEGSGPLFRVLSSALSVFDSSWRKVDPKYWHVGWTLHRNMVYKLRDSTKIKKAIRERIGKLLEQYSDTWWICESLAGGITVNPLSIYKGAHYFRWFNREPNDFAVMNYLVHHLGKRYDALAYVWVIFATLLNKIFRLNIGRWQNESFMCWENLEEFDEWMGKQLCKENRQITICDIYKALK